MRRVQPTGDAEHNLRILQRPQPLLQARHLDVVGLVAVLFQPFGIRRHEREALDVAPQADVARRWVELRTPMRRNDSARDPMVFAVVVERAHPQPLRAQQFEVDVGDRAPLPLREALRLHQTHAVLPDHGLTVPGQIGGRFTLSRSGVHVGGQAARRRRAGQQATVLGASDRDRAAGQVRDHRRTRQGGLCARRNRDEHVLADLDVQHEPGQIGSGEQQVGPERHVARRPSGWRRARRRRPPSGVARRTRDKSADTTSAPRRAPGPRWMTTAVL